MNYSTNKVHCCQLVSLRVEQRV